MSNNNWRSNYNNYNSRTTRPNTYGNRATSPTNRGYTSPYSNQYSTNNYTGSNTGKIHFPSYMNHTGYNNRGVNSYNQTSYSGKYGLGQPNSNYLKSNNGLTRRNDRNSLYTGQGKFPLTLSIQL